MWLLDTKTKQLREFHGWEKVNKCCEIATADGWKSVWIDTCCIDKTSSAELSEAINSMYCWYRNASVCYAYLSDLLDYEATGFGHTRWFTRGWTLQELLAPLSIVFFDLNWDEIGTRISLSHTIEAVSGISRHDMANFHECSIARRMSWASERSTTRSEDMAYCLMGLFDINMPILYGEGQDAFRRLQIEIMRTSDDDSILAWQRPLKPLQRQSATSCLAQHPSDFAASGDVRDMQKLWFQVKDNAAEYSGPRQSLTSVGLSMDLLCYEVKEYEGHEVDCIAQLHCTLGDHELPITILLVFNHGIYHRASSDALRIPFTGFLRTSRKQKPCRKRITLNVDFRSSNISRGPQHATATISLELGAGVTALSAHFVEFFKSYIDISSSEQVHKWVATSVCSSGPFDFDYYDYLVFILLIPGNSSQERHKVVLLASRGPFPDVYLHLIEHDDTISLEQGDVRMGTIAQPRLSMQRRGVTEHQLGKSQGTLRARARPTPRPIGARIEDREMYVKISVKIE